MVPGPYEIPKEGPVGRLLAAVGRHAWRPAHFHVKCSADGFRPLTTMIYLHGDPWLHDDTISSVKPGLVTELAKHDRPEELRARGLDRLLHRRLRPRPQARLRSARSAARRALALDPRQREARVALGLLPGWFRRWAETERAILGLLDDYPQFPALTSHYGNVLAQVARFDEAVAMQERTISKWPFMPGPPNQLIPALCGAGRLVEAEAQSEKAVRRWPRHPGVWHTRMSLLTYSGRADAALAFAADTANRPRGIEQEISAIVATARALAYRRTADVEVAMTANLQSVRDNISNAPTALHLFTALGDRDRSFDLIEAYLFRRGPLASGANPLTPFSQVYTDTLFHPYSRILWPDPRFAAITRKIGLDAYWKSIGFVPAFRR